MTAGRKPARVLYPFVLGAFPVLFLWAQNLQEDVSAPEALRLAALCVAGVTAAFGLLWLATRDPHRAGLATAVLAVLFFSFGRVEGELNWAADPALETQLLVAWGLFALAGTAYALRARTRAPKLTRSLNLVVSMLVLLNVIPIIANQFEETARATGRYVIPGVDPASVREKPDIYYVIFDRYASQETLTEQYGFDDADALGFLEQRGFYVARDSLANYPKTTHSLASSLNMTFLDDLARRMGADSGNWDPLYGMLRGFDVATGLQELGYRYYHLGSWWAPTSTDPDADVTMEFRSQSEFSAVFSRTTAWPTLADRVGIDQTADFERTEYERALFQFEALERIPDDSDPTFTFAHFTLPHPPYVFDVEGNYVTRAQADRIGPDAGYVQQVQYTNARMQELVDTLLAGADDPIIIIQSDEGPHPEALERDEDGYDWTEAPLEDLQRKLRILNAYYLPDGGENGLYSTITPVNTFRLIFNEYFGADLPLLPDRTWVFQDKAHPYRLTEVTDELAT
ncbi:MAG TPA: sulfatase-like hydrolase/transferase [Actinomycetota bacterium]|jgi:hypothetical protein|nr:sulfatase-like hydrolase/transferase [Actinomycetota bacterium]